MKRKTRAELEQRVIDLESQLIHRYEAAKKELDKTGESLHASAAVLRITGLGGREIVSPVAILNGLSKESIEALKRDLQRSFDSATHTK